MRRCSNRLKAAKTVVRRTFANPAVVQKLTNEDSYRFDAFTSRLDRVTQRIDRAVAGYAGMFDAIKAGLREGIEVVEVDANINDPEFAGKAVEMMLALIAQRK